MENYCLNRSFSSSNHVILDLENAVQKCVIMKSHELDLFQILKSRAYLLAYFAQYFTILQKLGLKGVKNM